MPRCAPRQTAEQHLSLPQRLGLLKLGRRLPPKSHQCSRSRHVVFLRQLLPHGCNATETHALWRKRSLGEHAPPAANRSLPQRSARGPAPPPAPPPPPAAPRPPPSRLAARRPATRPVPGTRSLGAAPPVNRCNLQLRLRMERANQRSGGPAVQLRDALPHARHMAHALRVQHQLSTGVGCSSALTRKGRLRVPAAQPSSCDTPATRLAPGTCTLGAAPPVDRR